jgi:peptidoglycan/xylan/chitin deacetylase (PgdA/CDA1 family)
MYNMKNIKIGRLSLIAMMLMIALISVASATPKVIFTFDDGHTSVYLKAFPILNANNQSGVAFLITGYVPGASGMYGWADLSLAQAKDMYSKGWDISSHTVSHYDLTTRNATVLNKELANSKNWLNSSGFIRSSRFLAYPYGAYNSAVIAAVKNNGYLAARTVSDNGGVYKAYKLTDSDVYSMKTLMVYPFAAYGSPAAPPSVVKDKINDTIAQNGLLILSFHIISDVCCVSGTNPPEEYKTSDFKIISDFLKAKEDAGQLDVVTMSEYFGIVGPTPDLTPPKITISAPTAKNYTEGTKVIASYSCTDDRSLKSCIGTVPNGAQINVTGVGTKTFRVNATDASGNNNSMSIVYTVVKAIPVPVTYVSHVKYASGFYKVNNQASPVLINLRKNDKVQWINDGSNKFTLVSSEKLWTNKSMSSGTKFTYTFTTAGNYTVYMKEKPNMRQSINVT